MAEASRHAAFDFAIARGVRRFEMTTMMFFTDGDWAEGAALERLFSHRPAAGHISTRLSHRSKSP